MSTSSEWLLYVRLVDAVFKLRLAATGQRSLPHGGLSTARREKLTKAHEEMEGLAAERTSRLLWTVGAPSRWPLR